jgi:hypothetical protein
MFSLIITCVILSLQEAILVPWRSLPRKVSKLYFAMRGLLNYSVVASVGGLCVACQIATDLSAIACLSTITCVETVWMGS